MSNDIAAPVRARPSPGARQPAIAPTDPPPHHAAEPSTAQNGKKPDADAPKPSTSAKPELPAFSWTRQWLPVVRAAAGTGTTAPQHQLRRAA